MLVNLSNEKKINKFYKMIPLYKSFFFYFTKFESNTKDRELKNIINALNIKNRRKRIDYVYDEACRIIDDFDAGKNICGFKNRKCYVQQCNGKNHINGCCRKCIYQSKSGCKTKNLACKLFVCTEVTKRNKVKTYSDLKILKILSLKNRTVVQSDYFSLREDVLKDLYTYTLTFAFIRILFRLITNHVKKRRMCFDNINK